jgi:hypothetical protein
LPIENRKWDDHKILASVLFIVLQPEPLRIIVGEIPSSSRSSFHRSRGNFIAAYFEKQFWRKWENILTLCVDERAVTDFLFLPE